jgi:hypothetical protein
MQTSEPAYKTRYWHQRHATVEVMQEKHYQPVTFTTGIHQSAHFVEVLDFMVSKVIPYKAGRIYCALFK